MPFSSSALTSVASLYCAGGWVNFCSLSSFDELERLALRERRQEPSSRPPRRPRAAGARVLVRRLVVDREEAGALHHLAGGAQRVVGRSRRRPG